MQTPKNFKCPTLSESSETYTGLELREAQLIKEASIMQSRIDELSAAARESNRTPKQFERDARVAALAGEPVSNVASEHAAKLSLMAQQLSDLRAAIEVVRTKKAHERIVASKTICDRFEPEYKRRVATVCKRILELREAVESYEVMTESFRAEDVAWSRLRPMSPMFFGGTRDPHSAPAAFLKEAATYKFFPLNEIPESYRR